MATVPPIKYWGEIHASKAKHIGCELGVVAILLYGSWNVRIASQKPNDVPRWVRLVYDALHTGGMSPPVIEYSAACVKVDVDQDSLDVCIDEESSGGFGAPSDLPALMFLALPTTINNGKRDSQGLRVEHVRYNSVALESLLTRPTSDASSWDGLKYQVFASSVFDALSRLVDSHGNIIRPKSEESRNISSINNHKINEPEVRLFVAGDRSQVGKSSICLGLLGALLNSGKYTPADLAYIKPATQCEQTQLVEEFCKHKGITACVPVGPIVYYKGFTRAFLKGETGETSEQLLQKASDAVDKLASNKRVVIIDGVGYPAVGSITGTDNASVAKVCGRSFAAERSNVTVRSPVPVLLVGKSGVGDAVDSFNINATYFAHKNVPVIGAIFNKLKLDGFYSLSNCKEAVDMYFGQSQPERFAFGFIPEIPSLTNAREQVADAFEAEQLALALESADLFVGEFSKHVNVDRIMNAAKESTEKYIAEHSLRNCDVQTSSKSKRLSTEMESIPDSARQFKLLRPAIATEYKGNNSTDVTHGFSLTREQIEALALVAGAAAG
ncbi:hypothetical protein ACHAW5_008442 [Stephanodiscus triporus]|uniref:Uncharacterized protein n=1 Tax=Stephanodiscus triporus TaxID=2934178 RepID=A0ABD3MKL8_9STRA